jgi:DMSO/TMAO reductase YedYZ molybdopterin-dependent catalytic subunit
MVLQPPGYVKSRVPLPGVAHRRRFLTSRETVDMAATDALQQACTALTVVSPDPFNAEAPAEALAADITPTDLHYVRCNFAIPAHDGVLTIGGQVSNPMNLTLEDLRAMPAVERTVTLECAGNGRLAQTPLPAGEPWGKNAVSTARWTGARLYEVLAHARADPTARNVVFVGADHGPYGHHKDIGFGRALTLAHAADPAAEILLAYEMNGAPLRPEHGAPFRLIVPHWYGMASVKWLKRIEVSTETYEGEFQTGHYMYEWQDHRREPVTSIRVRARITDPAPRSRMPAGRYTVRGKAWTGTGPVTSVEVSLTGGNDWQRAYLEPPASPYAWQDWSFDWHASRIGRHTLRARATDAAGNVQPDVPPWNRLGYGNNAVEVIYVDIS